ncbi:hypothetical protein [Cystobacter ferrugineus]|uniref:Uncharacterized protein n=1 Tax=Cystobacter ferrugineus TaxID=83449 RepID=A0A1L9B9A2_9BACT|nr:hypothetical protein [Cystobacter ferrugineus]OJH38837.1 hypothetical protein BON30_21685 [Cystobacter ferrugineus]
MTGNSTRDARFVRGLVSSVLIACTAGLGPSSPRDLASMLAELPLTLPFSLPLPPPYLLPVPGLDLPRIPLPLPVL